MQELSKKQLTRQDFVDNSIFDLLQKLMPRNEKLEWNIEVIGAIREIAQQYLLDEKKIKSELEFYPYLKHKTKI
jgi:hypothetical protein